MQFAKPLEAICIAHDFICSSNRTMREWLLNCRALRCVAVVCSINWGETAALSASRICKVVVGGYKCYLQNRNLLHGLLDCPPFCTLCSVCSHPGTLNVLNFPALEWGYLVGWGLQRFSLLWATRLLEVDTSQQRLLKSGASEFLQALQGREAPLSFSAVAHSLCLHEMQALQARSGPEWFLTDLEGLT